VAIVLTLLLVTILDTAVTLIGVARQAGFLDAEGRLPRLRQALLADSGAAMLGAALGTSTTTAYIESAWRREAAPVSPRSSLRRSLS
jgi:AGZA family xanthine/uracil permease-like MFS transporter